MRDEPRWDHGYRTHGYWIGVVQWGRVSIQARCFGRLPKTGAYGWDFTPEGVVPAHPTVDQTGKADTLRQAKREVEKRFRRWQDDRAGRFNKWQNGCGNSGESGR